jgi:Ca2+-binding RTX toxin-like protein
MATTPTVWLPFQISGLTAGSQTEPEIIGLSNGNILLVYTDGNDNYDPWGGSDIVARMMNPLGQVLWQSTINQAVADDELSPAIAAAANGGFVMAYRTDGIAGPGEGPDAQIRFERFDANGQNTYTAAIVLDGAGSNFLYPDIVSFADGSALISYVQYKLSNAVARANLVSSGNALGAQQTILSPAAIVGAENVVLSNGNVATTLWDTGFFPVLSIRTPAGATIASGQIYGGSFHPHPPQIAALTGGGLVAAWGNSAGSLFFEVRDNASVLISGNDVPVAPGGDLEESPDVVALPDGGFFMAWRNATLGRIEGQRFNELGSPVGTQVNLNLPLGQDPNSPELGLTADGRILVTYIQNQSNSPDIYYAILDPRGATITGTAGGEGITARLEGGTINAGGGNDTLYGMQGVDALSGEGGNDVLTGGAGNDTLDGGAGTDTANYADRALAVAINPFISAAAVSGGELDTILNFENFTGGSGNDTIQGTFGVNVISGGGGNDLIYAFDGADLVDGGAGNDIIAGGIGDDTITGGDGGDWLYGEDGNDNLSGTAKSGGAFDVIVGGNGADTLEGSGGGFDYFYGGVGVNGATGDGNDTYIVRAATGIKVMNDFEVGGTADVIRLLGTGFTTFAQVQAAMSFSGTINGTVLVVDGTTQIWFLNGTQPANLTAADFAFV